MYVCLLIITLTCSPKAGLRWAQLNGIGGTVMNDPGAQQQSQMCLTTTPGTPCPTPYEFCVGSLTSHSYLQQGL